MGNYGNMYDPSINAVPKSPIDSGLPLSNPGGSLGSMFGPISAGLNILQGAAQYEAARKKASGLHDDYKSLMRQAGEVLEQGFDTAIDIRQAGSRFLGTQMAAFGKSGSTFEGSAVAVALDTEYKVNKGAERAVEQARRDYRAMYYQAKKLKKAAKSAKKAGIASLVGTIGGPAAGSIYSLLSS